MGVSAWVFFTLFSYCKNTFSTSSLGGRASGGCPTPETSTLKFKLNFFHAGPHHKIKFNDLSEKKYRQQILYTLTPTNDTSNHVVASGNHATMSDDCADIHADSDTTAIVAGDTVAAIGGNADVKLKEHFAEIRELQLKDPTLAVYFSYLKQNVLPKDDNAAKRIVMESKRME